MERGPKNHTKPTVAKAGLGERALTGAIAFYKQKLSSHTTECPNPSLSCSDAGEIFAAAFPPLEALRLIADRIQNCGTLARGMRNGLEMQACDPDGNCDNGYPDCVGTVPGKAITLFTKIV